jgi:single-strand DNA-binding protein
LSFSIAVNRSKKNGDQWIDEANFFDVVSFGRLAEALEQYLNKGQQVAIEGYLKQDRWQQDGQNRSRVAIVAENIQLVGGKKDGAETTGGYQPRATGEGAQEVPRYAPPADDYPEDIPF